MDILALSWLLIVAFGVIMYVVLDGFGLGIGLISPFFKNQHDKDLIVSTILPVWDGNETWLVFVGATLYGGFPLAFSIILPAMYIPIMLMVVGLLLRGASFEFRLKSNRTKFVWNIAFFLGSLIATAMQGIIIGGLLVGFEMPDKFASFTAHQWFSPFSLFCAFCLIIGYGLLGSNRLIIKTTGEIQDKCYRISKVLQIISLISVAILMLWTMQLDKSIMHTWLDSKHGPVFLGLAISGGILFVMHYISLIKRHENAPYWILIIMFLISYAGLLLTIFPYIILHKLTYIEAAASDNALKFMLVGAIIVVPVLLYYSYYSYKIFSGKTHEKIGY
jgi:cytochrome bd ubiquinol oxidase subunit II